LISTDGPKFIVTATAQSSDLLDHPASPIRYFVDEHRITLLLQVGDLRAHQIQAVEHTADFGMGVRRQRRPERRAQRIKALTPVPQQRVVVPYPQRRQHGTDAVYQGHSLGHEFFPLTNAAPGILIVLRGDWHHRAHARLAA
jgi:hypothetical protein